jgi:hypothetical protein
VKDYLTDARFSKNKLTYKRINGIINCGGGNLQIMGLMHKQAGFRRIKSALVKLNINGAVNFKIPFACVFCSTNHLY